MLLSVKPELKIAMVNDLACHGIDFRSLAGLGAALRYVQAGRYISAVKLIEDFNPELTREQAKLIVSAFGYSNEFKRQEEQQFPVRCL